jgi:phage tail-like protein
MAVQRPDPYGAFNYRVTIQPQDGPEIGGAFSDVSGFSTEVQYAEYRDGTDAINAPRKIPTTYKVGDITLKRGLFGSTNLWAWIDMVMAGNPKARATVTIELIAEDNRDVVFTWKLFNARPSKWTGPTLAAKGGTEVAMEELVFVCENIAIE